MYIWVVKRFGTGGGVIHLVKGTRPAINFVSYTIHIFFSQDISSRTCVGFSALGLEPLPKLDFIAMNQLARLIPLLLGQVEQLPILLGQQDARLLKRLSHRTHPIHKTIHMPSRVALLGHLAVMERVDVPAGEDVRRRKRRRGLDAVQEKHLVRRGEKNHRGAGAGERRPVGRGS